MAVYRILLLYALSVVVFGDTCTKVDSCSCRWNNGSLVSLKSLALEHGIKYKDVTSDVGDALYFYNPCYAFTDGACDNVAVCGRTDDGQVIDYGIQDTVKFDIETAPTSADAVTIIYTSKDGKEKSKLFLICSSTVKENAFEVINMLPGSDPPTLIMKLTSPVCCPQASTPNNPNNPSTLSPGSIICIILVSVIVIYITGGVVFMVFIKKHKGVEAIPNHQFWKSLPGYVMDGVRFSTGRFNKQQYQTF